MADEVTPAIQPVDAGGAGQGSPPASVDEQVLQLAVQNLADSMTEQRKISQSMMDLLVKLVGAGNANSP